MGNEPASQWGSELTSNLMKTDGRIEIHTHFFSPASLLPPPTTSSFSYHLLLLLLPPPRLTISPPTFFPILKGNEETQVEILFYKKDGKNSEEKSLSFLGFFRFDNESLFSSFFFVN